MSKLNKPIQRSFEAEIKDVGNGRMQAIIASESIDRHGEVLKMDGLNITEYMKNPIIAAFHDYSKPSIGKTTSLTKTETGKLIAEFEFAVNVNPEAKLLYDLYKEGFQKAFSIGFIPEDMDGNTFTKSTMIEFSAVLVPANADALLLAQERGYELELIDSGETTRYKLVKTIESSAKGENEGSNMTLKDVREKALEDLTLKEISFLNENKEELTLKESRKFADVLDEDEEENSEAESGAEETTETAEGEENTEGEESGEEEEEDNMEKKLDKILDSKLKDIEKKLDKPQTKNFKKGTKPNASGFARDVSKEDKFKSYAIGLKTGNFQPYMDMVGKAAMTTTSTGEVLPPEEFIAEVQRLEEEFGVARRNADVRRSTSADGLRYVLGDTNLEIFDTSEAGFKKSTSLGYAELLLQWRKFAGILPLTDELLEDSAINLFRDATNRFARAFAEQEDKLVFTNSSSAGVNNLGITEVSGTNVVTVSGTNFSDLSYDDLSKARRGIPSPSSRNGAWYVNHETLGVIERMKDDNNQPLIRRDPATDFGMTILGRPVIETEVLPNLTEEAADTAFMVYGDLSYVTLGERTGMAMDTSNSAIVGDPDEEDQEANTINSWTQDLTSLRAVKRMNAVVRFADAFSVIKTQSSS